MSSAVPETNIFPQKNIPEISKELIPNISKDFQEVLQNSYPECPSQAEQLLSWHIDLCWQIARTTRRITHGQPQHLGNVSPMES